MKDVALCGQDTDGRRNEEQEPDVRYLWRARLTAHDPADHDGTVAGDF